MVIIKGKCKCYSALPIQLEIPVVDGASVYLDLAKYKKNYSSAYLCEGYNMYPTEAMILMDIDKVIAVVFKDKYKESHWYIYVLELDETTTWIGEPTVENIIKFIEGFKCLYR